METHGQLTPYYYTPHQVFQRSDVPGVSSTRPERQNTGQFVQLSVSVRFAVGGAGGVSAAIVRSRTRVSIILAFNTRMIDTPGNWTRDREEHRIGIHSGMECGTEKCTGGRRRKSHM